MNFSIYLIGFLAFLACLISLVIFAFKRKKKRNIFISLGISFLFMIISTTISNGTNTNNQNEIDSSSDDSILITSTNNQNVLQNVPTQVILPFEQKLKIHFLDVGQADSILIELPNKKNILIDAGNNADSEYISSYINTLGIKQFDLVIGTHPHEDHIGSLDTIINNYTVKQIIMPKVPANTKTFEDVLTSIAAKNLKITAPIPEQTYIYDNAKLTILAPNSTEYADVNNYSVVTKLEYGENSFLFTGDAENISENEILLKKFDIKADLLKVGHHGSNSSTTSEFLKAVNPTHAVISCGKDNKYGHPNTETIDILNSNNIGVYRTDEVGAIIATSDGKNITIDKNKSTIQINAPPIIKTNNTASEKIDLPAGTKFIGNKNSHKLHSLNCAFAKKIDLKNKVYFKDITTAQNQGYQPCGHCKPFVIISQNNKQTTPEKNTNSTPMYVGSKNSDKFHKLNCSSAKRIKKSNLVYFYSRQEAINAGYIPCKRCHP